MKLVPIDLSDIPETGNGGVTKHRIRQIEAFLESGAEAVEVLEYKGDAGNVATALAAAAHRHGYAATAICRRGRVFLVRKDRADRKGK